MTQSNDNWGADVPISEPVPSEQELKIDFNGFGFTMGGITFAVSQDELDDMLRPIFHPEGYMDDDDLSPLIQLGDDQFGSAEGG